MRKLSVVLLMLVCALTGLIFSGCGRDYIVCPDFVGKDYNVITTVDRYDMLKFEVEYIDDDVHDTGIIIEQNVPKNEKISQGTTIKLKVSLGPQKTGVPSVVGQKADLVKQSMQKAGFDITFVYAPNSQVSEGFCYKTEPGADQQHKVGGKVTAYISTGTEKRFIPYVNTVGKTLEQAKKTISDAGFNLGQVVYKESKRPTGTVIEQFPSYLGSIEIVEGSSVNIIIAKPKDKE